MRTCYSNLSNPHLYTNLEAEERYPAVANETKGHKIKIPPNPPSSSVRSSPVIEHNMTLRGIPTFNVLTSTAFSVYSSTFMITSNASLPDSSIDGFRNSMTSIAIKGTNL